MGCFTSIYDKKRDELLQIYGGDDTCKQYKVGDTVDWHLDKRNPGQGHLLDGVYQAYSDDNSDPYVVIKDHKVHAIIESANYKTEDEDFPGDFYINEHKMLEEFQITPYDKNWWSEKLWKKKEEKDNRIEKAARVDREYLASLSEEDRAQEIIKRIVAPIRGNLNYNSIAKEAFSITPLSEENILETDKYIDLSKITQEKKEKLAASMVCPFRCGGLDYDDEGPFYMVDGKKVRRPRVIK